MPTWQAVATLIAAVIAAAVAGASWYFGHRQSARLHQLALDNARVLQDSSALHAKGLQEASIEANQKIHIATTDQIRRSQEFDRYNAGISFLYSESAGLADRGLDILYQMVGSEAVDRETKELAIQAITDLKNRR